MTSALVLLVACAPTPVRLGSLGSGPGPVLSSEVVRRGGQPAPPDDADVVLLYGGEQRGDLGPCGCEARPMGSLARVETYRSRTARQQPEPLLLNAGGWLDDSVDGTGALRPDIVLADERMVDGLVQGRWQVWNIGAPDLPWVLDQGMPDRAVSANLAGAPSHRLLTVGDFTVAVTGVGSGEEFSDPVQALTALVPTLQADLVVVLAHQPGRAARDLARLPGIDVLIEAGGYGQHHAPMWEGQAIWVRSNDQTRALGELRLVLQDGVVAARERQIELDASVPAGGPLLRLQRRTDRQVDAMQRALYLP